MRLLIKTKNKEQKGNLEHMLIFICPETFVIHLLYIYIYIHLIHFYTVSFIYILNELMF